MSFELIFIPTYNIYVFFMPYGIQMGVCSKEAMWTTTNTYTNTYTH
jgi:hypothetical protein